MKTHRYLILACICFFLAGYMVRAQAAGPATNVVTLYWVVTNTATVPYVFEIQQSNLTTNSWTVLATVPSTQTNLTIQIDKTSKFWRVHAVNATNGAWSDDFSNVASTAWPNVGGLLAIRPGP